MLHSEYMMSFGKPLNRIWKDTDAKELAIRLYNFYTDYDPYGLGMEEDRLSALIDEYNMLMSDCDTGEADTFLDGLNEIKAESISDLTEVDADRLEELIEDLDMFKKTWRQETSLLGKEN